MGSSMSAIYNDYDLYITLCKIKDVKPVDIEDDFYISGKNIINSFTEEENIKYKNSYIYNKFK